MLVGFINTVSQVSKKDPGLHKRQQSLISSPTDRGLEEGLLENQEDSEEASEPKGETIMLKNSDQHRDKEVALADGKAETLPS